MWLSLTNKDHNNYLELFVIDKSLSDFGELHQSSRISMLCYENNH